MGQSYQIVMGVGSEEQGGRDSPGYMVLIK